MRPNHACPEQRAYSTQSECEMEDDDGGSLLTRLHPSVTSQILAALDPHSLGAVSCAAKELRALSLPLVQTVKVQSAR